MALEKITLPEDLGSRSLLMFDDLVSRGKLFYNESKSEIVSHNGFKFEFRISPALKRKPYLERDDPKRTADKGPFLNPDPDFVVAQVGLHHTLKLNLCCMYRPAFVLYTRIFKPQTQDLNFVDVEAARAVMAALKPTLGPQLMIYNCGVDAGSSQGHKHMQIFPQPTDFPLYPQQATSDSDINSNIFGVPNMHFVLRLSQGVTSQEADCNLARLVSASRDFQTTARYGSDYNVVMAEDWVCVVPRRLVGREGVGANGAGMVGLVWLRDQAERDGWNSFGLTEHLVQLGVPRT
ncbi:hypothetical protein CaCOL14_002009 [Colletotrichum acutatum]|uniref:Phosphorylase n=1 Tax=Glomerella acutata TaxID=27357 RepID=A0AAD8UJU2_GLOAC|nr:uncharacterized protein BDZ83DRAFT_581603 [Colletotrichum acutatum]KAK1723064.1 hypothetical protein BDZ83DRAFT_581603 [Colletotrichum acutatum]